MIIDGFGIGTFLAALSNFDSISVEALTPSPSLTVVGLGRVKCQGYPSSSPPSFTHLLAANDLARPALCPPRSGLSPLELPLDGFALQSVAARLTPPAHLLSRDPTRPALPHRTFAYLTRALQHSSLTSTR